MITSGLAAGLTIALASLATPPWAWAKIGGYFLFQPSRLGQYFILFCLGVVSAKRRWFASKVFPGPTWLWGLAALLLTVACFSLIKQVMVIRGGWPLGTSLVFGLLRAFVCLAWLGFLAKAAHRWWNRPNRPSASLARGSYDIYLLHLPIVVGLQLAAMHVQVGYFMKFAVESVLGIIVCWLLSRRLAAPHPKAAAALLVAAFAVACLLL